MQHMKSNTFTHRILHRRRKFLGSVLLADRMWNIRRSHRVGVERRLHKSWQTGWWYIRLRVQQVRPGFRRCSIEVIFLYSMSIRVCVPSTNYIFRVLNLSMYFAEKTNSCISDNQNKLLKNTKLFQVYLML